MTSNKRKYVKPTPEDLEIIEDCIRRSVEERLAVGDIEIADYDDWSGITEEPGKKRVSISKTVYRRLQSASNTWRESPDRLASKWISESLANSSKRT